jgi:hypothetical protein
MRIILLDSDINFTSSVSQRWKKFSVYCQVFPQTNAAFAELKKDPDAVDIVLIAKELGGGQDGLAAAQSLRKDPKTADVPYLLMSSAWGKPDFAKHQKTEFGANAYYSRKDPVTELESMIEAVTGFKFSAAAAAPEGAGDGKQTTTSLEVKLEAADEVVNIEEAIPDNISMEAPINLFPDGEPPPTPTKATTTAITMPGVEEPPGETKMTSVDLGPQPVEEAAPPPPPAPEPVVEAAPEPIAAAPAPAPVPVPEPAAAGGIGIAVGNMDFQLETSSKPTASAPETPPAPEPVAVAAPEPVAVSVTAAEPAAEAAAAAAPSLDLAASLDLSAAPPPPPEPQAAEVSLTTDEPAPDITAAVTKAQPVPQQAAEMVAVSEEEAAKDLPYLFAGSSGGSAAGVAAATSAGFTRSAVTQAAAVAESSGGGSGDTETLKKYLTMREQDVSVLTAQLTYAKEELAKCNETIKRMTLESEDLAHQINDLRERVAAQDQQLLHAQKSTEGEVEQLRFELKAKIDRIKFLEDRLTDSGHQYEKLKERVRHDIRKIRVREKELESKLEILKKDSETLIAARENKILELKRKIDLLEFNYDTLQDKNELERQNVAKANEKIDRVLKVLKLAMGVIEGEQAGQAQEPPASKAS